MNKDQEKTVIRYLLSKNLPLDLLVEVEDHMKEQLGYKMDFEGKTFDEAWKEVQESWKEDLKFSYSFGVFKKITKFQKKVINKTSSKLFWKSLKIGFIPVLPFVFLLFYNKLWASYWMFIMYALIFVVLLGNLILNFKIIKSGTRNEKRNISFIQGSMIIYTLSVVYIPFNILTGYSEHFENFYQRIIKIYHLEATFGDAFMVSYYILLLFSGIYSMLVFRMYKKQVQFLQQKINFKL